MRPVVYFVGGEGSNCKMDRDVTDFPEPLSPTSASVSPLLIVNDMFFTADVVPYSLTNSMDKSSIEIRVSRFSNFQIFKFSNLILIS